MHLIEKLTTIITFLASLLTLSPVEQPGIEEQTPLLGPNNGLLAPNDPLPAFNDALDQGKTFDQPAAQELSLPKGPIFKPPSAPLEGPGSDIQCNYTKMVGFTNCSTPTNRACWLTNGIYTYDINTDYEDSNKTPIGIHRNYTLNLTDSWVNADGINFTYASLFNNSYPGPWIQACWGDNVTIIVNNNLQSNGTSVHWHGIRQWKTMHMDGVNGVTQCPVAPGDSFNYTFRAMQYGSSWYHSHFSVQYADGTLGPLTIHGPSSASWDEPKAPILMSDWGHNSAFEAQFTGKLINRTILLNGTGNVTRYSNLTPTLPIPPTYNITFERGKRYLLRLINTAFDSQFIFSIDNHTLEVIASDFVPIKPYNATYVSVGIGQRYHVIVNATDPLGTNGSYWIRTYKADCFRFNNSDNSTIPGYERTGIVKYSDSRADPDPHPEPAPPDFTCEDEDKDKLVPIVPWNVPNWNVSINPGHDKSPLFGENMTVELSSQFATTYYPLAFASLGGEDFNPLSVDYGNPTFLNLNYTMKWNPLWVVLPENRTDQDWVYLAIGTNATQKFGAHPIHLHGHDFAILAQVPNATVPTDPSQLNLTYQNPARRDVVLLPSDGYIIIAFKTDNPGIWLVHCHIADHASAGLAMQILERQKAAADLWPSLNQSEALRTATAGCQKWNRWSSNCNNWWPGDGSTCVGGEHQFSPDAGI